MAVKQGVDVLVYVNTGTEATPVWTAVAGQRNATLTLETEDLDITTKDSSGAMRERVPTFVSWSVSCDGLWVESDTGLQALRDAWRNRNLVQIRVKFAEDDIEEGQAIVASIDLEAPYDDAATYAAEFSGASELTHLTSM